jgi:hypothetical protein
MFGDVFIDVVVGIGMRHDAEQQHCDQAKALHVRSPSVRPAAAILRRAGRARWFRSLRLQIGKLECFRAKRKPVRANKTRQAKQSELSPKIQPDSWMPPDRVLSDPCIDVLVVAGVTDTVVAFYRGERIGFPRAVSASPANGA